MSARLLPVIAVSGIALFGIEVVAQRSVGGPCICDPYYVIRPPGFDCAALCRQTNRPPPDPPPDPFAAYRAGREGAVAVLRDALQRQQLDVTAGANRQARSVAAIAQSLLSRLIASVPRERDSDLTGAIAELGMFFDGWRRSLDDGISGLRGLRNEVRNQNNREADLASAIGLRLPETSLRPLLAIYSEQMFLDREAYARRFEMALTQLDTDAIALAREVLRKSGRAGSELRYGSGLPGDIVSSIRSSARAAAMAALPMISGPRASGPADWEFRHRSFDLPGLPFPGPRTTGTPPAQITVAQLPNQAEIVTARIDEYAEQRWSTEQALQEGAEIWARLRQVGGRENEMRQRYIDAQNWLWFNQDRVRELVQRIEEDRQQMLYRIVRRQAWEYFDRTIAQLLPNKADATAMQRFARVQERVAIFARDEFGLLGQGVNALAGGDAAEISQIELLMEGAVCRFASSVQTTAFPIPQPLRSFFPNPPCD